MRIRTDSPIIKDRFKIQNKIANFWNRTTESWHLIWGPHIHHGFYENETLTAVEAQEKLIEKILELIIIPPNSKILDVGCGMGGSSIYLAQKYDTYITGITLSKKQVDLAEAASRKVNVRKINFIVEDALSMQSLPNNSFDIVWSLESCEQFYDKKLFIQQAYRVLKPGGTLMLATWCSNQDEYVDQLAKNYQKLCLAFDLPYMPTKNYYRKLLTDYFTIKQDLDWSQYVKKSWQQGLSLIKQHQFLKLLKFGGWRGFLFLRQLKLMRHAFDQGSVKYGVFICEKKI